MPLQPIDDAAPHRAGLQAGELRLQRCTGCGRFRHYPRPMCPHCHAFEHDWQGVTGEGTVHSWTVLHHSALPALVGQLPLVLLTVDLPEGVRLLGPLIGADGSLLAVGQAVRTSIQADAEGTLRPVFHRR